MLSYFAILGNFFIEKKVFGALFAVKKMNQRNCIKFYVKNNNKCSNAFEVQKCL